MLVMQAPFPLLSQGHNKTRTAQSVRPRHCRESGRPARRAPLSSGQRHTVETASADLGVAHVKAKALRWSETEARLLQPFPHKCL